MKDVEIIEKLNTKLRAPLKRREKLTWFLRGYCLNEHGHVTQLNLFNAHLNGQLPEEIFLLKHLEHLDIRDNNLHMLPEDIIQLKQLQFLDARHNHIFDLPTGVSQLENLEKLYLGQNFFTSIPSIVSELESLWLIDFTENTVSEGCEHVINAPMVTNIYLKKNEICHFPFDKITAHIDEINLCDNPLNIESTFKHDKINNLIINT